MNYHFFANKIENKVFTNKKIMKDSVSLVVLEVYQNNFKAHIVKSLLESNGIDCAVYEDNFASVLPVHDSSSSGVKIMVREDDFEKAFAILQQSNEISEDFDEHLQ